MKRLFCKPSGIIAALSTSGTYLPRVASRNFGSNPNPIALIRQKVEKFVHEEVIPNAARLDATGEFPWELIRKAHALGIMGSDLPVELGGLNLTLKSKVKIYESIAYGDTALGTTMMVSELAQAPLLHAGSAFLREKYLKRILEKPILSAMAVTEKEAGSDVANLKTVAEKRDGHYILNGSKKWITNCGVADWYFVLARTAEEAPTKDALTGFVVERSSNGLTTGERERNMGQRCCDNRELFLENVVVPNENVVGKEGAGFGLTMQAFDRTRPIVASMACGLLRRALVEATKYANERKTFGKAIMEYQGISFKLADMAISLEAAIGLVEKAAEKVDAREWDATYFSAIAKCFATDSAFQAAANAVQVLGGNGFSTHFPVEKLLRDSKTLQIYGGTSEIQRVVVARSLTKKYL